jgi:hypothetical protein
VSVDRDARTGPDRRRRPRGGRREIDLGLRSPDACPQHPHGASRVIEPIHHKGLIIRRHRCLELGCVETWESYQTIINPERIKLLIARARRTS